MFTGIIEEVGTIMKIERSAGSVLLAVDAPHSTKELKVNDSVSVNGVCQTVVSTRESTFTIQAVEETLSKTTLGDLRQAARVNLELPVKLGGRLGGHLVQGHVDCVGSVATIEKRESSWIIAVEFPEQFYRNIVPLGSITIDGVSLTVVSVGDRTFTVSIIPHTLDKTILVDYKPGTRVNLEFDLVGKYIQHLLESRSGTSGRGISGVQLREWGYEEGL